MWAIAKTKIMCWELEQASEQKSKHASKQRSAKKWPLKLYLQSILQSYVKWGCVYMETVCFNIRILYMWHNVHIDVCLSNCQHAWTVARRNTKMYVCTYGRNVLLYMCAYKASCTIVHMSFIYWGLLPSYACDIHILQQCVRTDKGVTVLWANTTTCTVRSYVVIREVHGLYIVCHIKSSLLGILYVCVKRLNLI